MRKNYTIYKRSNKRCHENSNRREHGVSGCMTSGGTTIKYHLWNEVYYRNDMWSGAEQNDRRGISISKLKREIGEKKKKMVLLVFACFAR